MKVDYINHMGDDLTVVNSARVSFDKESDWEAPTPGWESDYPTLTSRDRKLIGYLADHNHWTPFSHCVVTLRETVPIFVARQRFKHTVGFSYNEVSRRYVDKEPTFYEPKEWRAKADNKKQGSSEEILTTFWSHAGEDGYGEFYIEETLKETLEYHHKWSLQYYNDLIRSGVCPEQARMVLPQSMYTSYYVTGSLAAWARAYKLRSHPDSQKEIQDLAKQWTQIIAPLFPVSWAALLGGSSSDETTVDGVSSPSPSSNVTTSNTPTTTSTKIEQLELSF